MKLTRGGFFKTLAGVFVAAKAAPALVPAAPVRTISGVVEKAYVQEFGPPFHPNCRCVIDITSHDTPGIWRQKVSTLLDQGSWGQR